MVTETRATGWIVPFRACPGTQKLIQALIGTNPARRALTFFMGSDALGTPPRIWQLVDQASLLQQRAVLFHVGLGNGEGAGVVGKRQRFAIHNLLEHHHALIAHGVEILRDGALHDAAFHKVEHLYGIVNADADDIVLVAFALDKVGDAGRALPVRAYDYVEVRIRFFERGAFIRCRLRVGIAFVLNEYGIGVFCLDYLGHFGKLLVLCRNG